MSLLFWTSRTQLTTLDISNNKELVDAELIVRGPWVNLKIQDMPTLGEVCVDTTLNPEKIDTTNSPNVCIETDCNGVCGEDNTSSGEYGESRELIFPNPTYGQVFIKTQGKGLHLIEIASLNGQLLITGEIAGTTHQLDLSSFPKGVYFITVRSEDFVTTRKIIKL